jgi:hypothetical protein
MNRRKVLEVGDFDHFMILRAHTGPDASVSSRTRQTLLIGLRYFGFGSIARHRPNRSTSLLSAI